MSSAVVCGGAYSLINDIKKVPQDAIRISINHHAAFMINCEWMATIDPSRIIDKKMVYMDINKADCKGLRTIGYSGTTGISFALTRLKVDVVYVAGMDLYLTDYYYTETKPEGIKRPHSERVEFWYNYKNMLGKEAKRVKPISGPLVEIWSS